VVHLLIFRLTHFHMRSEKAANTQGVNDDL